MHPLPGISEVIGNNYRSAGFNPEKIHRYSLRLLLSPGMLQYLITDEKKKQILVLQTESIPAIPHALWPGEIKDFLGRNKFFSGEWQEVKIALFTPQCTLVPEALYHDSMKNELLRLSTSHDETGLVMSDLLDQGEIRLLYAVPDSLLGVLSSYFSGKEMVHASGALINYLLNNCHHQSPVVYVNVGQEMMQVVVIRDSKLLLANNFPFHAKEDFIFFLLYVYRELELNPELIPAQLMGTIPADSFLYHSIRKYVREVSFHDWENSYSASDSYSVPAHYYLNLFCL